MSLTRLTTRFVILLLVAAVLWISKDALLRRAAVATAESIVGARVDVGHLRSDLQEHRLFLQDVAIADPRNPMRNLIQADHVTLDIDPQALLHRRWIADHGTATQVRFGAPRTRSGAIGEPNLLTRTPEADPSFVNEQRVRLHEHWTTQFRRRSFPDVDHLTEAMDAVASEWESTWPGWLQKQKELVEDLRSQIVQFHAELQKKGTNPLRNHVSAETLQSRHRELDLLLQEAGERIAHFRGEAERERTRLRDAARRDRQRVQSAMSGTAVDAALVNQLILDSTVRKQIGQIVDWFDDFRESIPDPSQLFNTQPARGIDCWPADLASPPSFLIRNLEIDGEGRFAGQHFNFSGTLENLTTEPQRLDQPARFSLQAQGNTMVRLSGTIDRRGEVPVDALLVECPRMQLEAGKWGTENLLSAATTPARLSGQISLRSIGQEVNGEVNLSYGDLMMQLDHMELPPSLADVVPEINLNLASINHFEINAKVSGPIHDPKLSIESDLGEQLAGVINTVIAKHQKREFDAYDQMIGEREARYLEHLEKNTIGPLELLATALATERSRLVQMAEKLPAPTDDGSIRR